MGSPRDRIGSNEAATPPLSLTEKLSADQAAQRKKENRKCEELCEREGDRLLKAGDTVGAEAAHRIAAIIRIRRDAFLEPF